MLVGVPKEIKTRESRVGLVPASVAELVHRGHQVIVETSAGAGIGASDAEYAAAGAQIAATAADVFARAEMVIKVKEPQPNEWVQLSEGQILFTYLHLAADPDQAFGLAKSGCTAIAYETITDDAGGLPLLAPMSEVAGRLAVIEGASHLKANNGGRGVLISGVPGTEPAEIMIIGGGVVGMNAAKIAIGLGARVSVFDRSLPRLRYLSDIFGNGVTTRYASSAAIAKAITTADIVIGAVLVPGAAAPKLVTRAQLADIQQGTVLVDVAIDQGGCFETSRPTTHDDPTYIVDGIVHYCVANMPGSVPRTSSEALNNATLPYVLALAEKGFSALDDNPHLANGLNVAGGKVVCQAVLDALSNKNAA